MSIKPASVSITLKKYRKPKFTKSYPKVPPQHIQVLKHVLGRDGITKLAARLGISNSIVYRLISDSGKTTVRATTLAKIGSVVEAERGKTTTIDTALDFKSGVLAVMRALRGLGTKDRRDILEFCLDSLEAGS